MRLPKSWSKTGQAFGLDARRRVHSEAVKRAIAVAANQAGIAQEKRLQPLALAAGSIAPIVHDAGGNGEGTHRHEVLPKIAQHSDVAQRARWWATPRAENAAPRWARLRPESELSYTRAAVAVAEVDRSPGGQIDVVIHESALRCSRSKPGSGARDRR